MSLLVLVVLALCVAAGMGLTYLAGAPLRFEERLAVSGPLGALVVGLACWLASVPLGFDLRTVALSLVVATALSLPGWYRGAPLLADEWSDLRRRVGLRWSDPQSVRPLVALLAVAWPITIRIFALAWQRTGDGGLAAGHLSTWADGSAHLAYAGRFVTGGHVPIDSPIAAGEPARYHLLADLFGAQVSLLGVSLPSALAVTSGFLALFVPAVFYVCGVRLTGSRHAALLGVVIFCAGGSFGFVHLFQDIGDQGFTILRHLPRDYSRDPDSSLWMDNPSLSYLHAQRNGLFGLPLGLAALTLVRTALEERRPNALVAAGVLVGALPLANGFAFTICVALVLAWAVLDRQHAWWRFFLPALVVGGPAALWLQPPKSSVRWFPGWMSSGGLDGWAWFWFRNLGPFLILLVIACLWSGTVRKGFARAFLPAWLLWVVPNLVAFHPWEWNNTKYFAFWQLLGSFLVGALLVRVARTGWLGKGTVAAALVLLCLSGVADLSRATDRRSAIGWASADGLRVSAWIRDEVPADDIVAVAPSNYEPVVSLSGHRAVSGFAGWTFDLGVPDWQQRAEDEVAILRGGPGTAALVARRDVAFVVIGPVERQPEFGGDDAWWAEHGTAVYRSGEWTVYATR
ncbi:hypothetical protein BH10ACT1_BH10ACT1_15030 [soil metagenome]